ncbi:MAG: hypothetical protein LBU85_10255 [Treponema sp.]|nr:hypothetical protein [Treponema sp.]
MEVKDKDYLIKEFAEQLMIQFPEFTKQMDILETLEPLEFHYSLFGDFGMFMREEEDEKIFIKINDFFNSYLKHGIDEIANLVFVGFFESLTLESLTRLMNVATDETESLLRWYYDISCFWP